MERQNYSDNSPLSMFKRVRIDENTESLANETLQTFKGISERPRSILKKKSLPFDKKDLLNVCFSRCSCSTDPEESNSWALKARWQVKEQPTSLWLPPLCFWRSTIDWEGWEAQLKRALMVGHCEISPPPEGSGRSCNTWQEFVFTTIANTKDTYQPLTKGKA